MSEEMTRKEVIDWLYRLKSNVPTFMPKIWHEKFIKALQFAITSLETDEAYQLEYESTTKNDLGVDCILRADARSLICNTDIKHHMSGMTRKVFKDLYNGMDELHSVTPIRPTGHWIEEFNDLEGEVRFTCSSCGKYQLFGTDFCYNCGAKMEEVGE